MPTTATETAVEQLVSDHLYLVQHIVHELAARYPRHVDRQELWSAGALGLVEAARRYDPDSEVAFRHFARRRIRGAIIDSTRSRDWVSRSVRRDGRELDAASRDFEQRHHRPATEADLADQLGIDEDEVVRRRAAAERGTLLHLDARSGVVDEDQELTLVDVVETRDVTTSPEQRVAQRELVGALRTAVDELPEPHRTVVDRYYLQEHLLRDIADDMGVTEARVSQLRSEAVHAVQSLLGSVEFDVPPVPASAPGRRRRAAYVAAASQNTTWRQRMQAAQQLEASANLADLAG